MPSTINDRLDGISTSVAIKAPCQAVATTNITLSGEQTVGGVAVVAVNAAGRPDRVLCTGQTNPVENGIWDVSTGAWSRSKDFNGNRDVVQGTLIEVYRAAGLSPFYRVTSANPVLIGTSNITFEEIPLDADVLRADLANTTDATKGAALVAGVEKFYESFAAAMAADNSAFNIIGTHSFLGGWAGTTAGPKGDAPYHRDGTTGTASTAYADNSGFYDANGIGFRIAPTGENHCVEQFSATIDGVTDDTTAWHNYASWANGRDLYMRSTGISIITENIDANDAVGRIVGSVFAYFTHTNLGSSGDTSGSTDYSAFGDRCSVIKCVGCNLIGAPDTAGSVNANAIGNFKGIKNLFVWGSSAGSNMGIYCIPADVTIEDSTIVDFGWYGYCQRNGVTTRFKNVGTRGNGWNKSETGMPFATWATHTGSNNAATLTDSSANWVANQWVGYTINNTTDGSSGTITANTATTITATLSGGSDNDWDTSDSYTITGTAVNGQRYSYDSGCAFKFVANETAEDFHTIDLAAFGAAQTRRPTTIIMDSCYGTAANDLLASGVSGLRYIQAAGVRTMVLNQVGSYHGSYFGLCSEMTTNSFHGETLATDGVYASDATRKTVLLRDCASTWVEPLETVVIDQSNSGITTGAINTWRNVIIRRGRVVSGVVETYVESDYPLETGLGRKTLASVNGGGADTVSWTGIIPEGFTAFVIASCTYLSSPSSVATACFLVTRNATAVSSFQVATNPVAGGFGIEITDCTCATGDGDLDVEITFGASWTGGGVFYVDISVLGVDSFYSA